MPETTDVDSSLEQTKEEKPSPESTKPLPSYTDIGFGMYRGSLSARVIYPPVTEFIESTGSTEQTESQSQYRIRESVLPDSTQDRESDKSSGQPSETPSHQDTSQEVTKTEPQSSGDQTPAQPK